MNRRSGRPELLKQINRKRAFEVLQSQRVFSRPKLAKAIGVSRATIDSVADDLLRAGVAIEEGLGTSTGGRPPMMLKFNPKAAYALGARMRDHTWGIVLTDLDAQRIHETDREIMGNSPEAAVNALTQGVEAIMERVDAHKILPAIGLGTPGLVDMRSNVIITAVDVGWVDVPIGKMVEEALGLKVFVANRSKVGALAESWYGTGRDNEDLIYISIGTGIAAGIVHGGELFIGVNSSAGELGHVTIVPDGPLCPCGNRGCLQELISATAIANRARAKMRLRDDSSLHDVVGNYPEQLTAEEIFLAAEQEDALALEVVAETASYLGIAVANLINLFNPKRVVIGGPVGQAGHVLLAPLQAEVQRRAMAHPLSTAEIVISSYNPYAGAVGAAVLVLQHASDFVLDRIPIPGTG